MPIEVARPIGRPHEMDCPSNAPRETGKSTIAIIDDDGDTREAPHGLLRSVGFQVESFASIQGFLDLARLSPLACLVLDVWMPERNGLDFQADLRQAGVHLPVIFMSGHADVHMRVQAMKAGAVEFLTKPIRHQDLLDAIQLAIKSVSPRRPLSTTADLSRLHRAFCDNSAVITAGLAPIPTS